MRISKLCLVVCAVTVCGAVPSMRAEDSPAQAAARAALEQQMQAMDAQQATKNAPSSAPATPAQPTAPAAKTHAPNATNAQPTQSLPVTVTSAGATEQQPGNQSAAAAAPAVHPGSNLFAPVPPPSGGVPPSAVLEQSTQSSAPTVVASTTYSGPTEQAQNKNSAAIPGGELGLKPIVAPPLPISGEQEAQLRALLEKYEAGTITPVQYQAERKKILSQPH
jgi:hypothetical protein